MKRFTVRPRFTSGREVRIGGATQQDDYILIGRLGEAGQIVDVKYDVSNQHVIAIVGKRGSGKSYTLGTFVEGLCSKANRSPIAQIARTRAILLFDTLGIFQWTDIMLSPDSPQEIVRQQHAVRRGWDLEATPLDVSVWLPRAESSRPPAGRHREFTIKSSDFGASDWGYLLDLDVLQDRMGQLLNDAYIKVTVDGWTDGDRTCGPVSEYAVDDLIACIRQDTELDANYQVETRRAVVQQLLTYARNPLFEARGTDLRDLLRPGVLSVVIMNKMSDELRFVVISSLIRRIMRARIEASEIEKDLAIRSDIRPDDRARAEEAQSVGIPACWIAADEAQNFLPAERRTGAADVLVRLVREGRNYGLSFILTTQQPAAIDPRILAQVDTVVAHKLTVQSDIEYVRRNLKSGFPKDIRYANAELGFDDLLRSLDVGQALVSNTEADRAFVLDVRPRMSVHGGF